jgi:hypothetical protein
VKHPRLVVLEGAAPADLIAELRVLALLVHDAADLVRVRARIPSNGWESWARRARAALGHEIVDLARRLP